MMLLRKIESSFFRIQNVSVYWNNNNIIDLVNGVRYLKIDGGNITNVFFVNSIAIVEYLSTLDGFEKTIFYDIDKEVLSKPFDFLWRGNTQDGNIIVQKYIDSQGSNYGILDIDMNYKIYWFGKSKGYLTFLYNNSIFTAGEKVVTLLRKENKKWDVIFEMPNYLDLQERLVSPKIEKFIGVYEQQLWILFSNNRFVVLDVESGKELFQIEDLKTTLNVEGLKVGEVFMDHAREKLLILAFKYYIEIDLKTRKCSIKKILEEDGWYIGKGTNYEGDNNIYFCGKRSDIKFHSIGNTSAGIFNTETYEVEWHYTLEREEKNYFFADVPQANNKYFGVKDCENTLFLFER